MSDESCLNLWDHEGRVLPVNTAFQSALSKDIVREQLELWSGAQFHIMDEDICYELWVISIAKGTSVKCNSAKSSPSFKTSLELSFTKKMHAHMLPMLFEQNKIKSDNKSFRHPCFIKRGILQLILHYFDHLDQISDSFTTSWIILYHFKTEYSGWGFSYHDEIAISICSFSYKCFNFFYTPLSSIPSLSFYIFQR